MRLYRFLYIERMLKFLSTLMYVVLVECDMLTWETEVGEARWCLLRQRDLFLNIEQKRRLPRISNQK